LGQHAKDASLGKLNTKAKNDEGMNHIMFKEERVAFRLKETGITCDVHLIGS
jgi:hypothetical protein